MSSNSGSYRYLTLDEAIELHRQIMMRTGSSQQPLRAPGSLESALHRPQAAAYYEEADLIRQAALLAVGVAEAQAFLEGNKRTSFACLDVFLRLNGYEYAGEPLDLAKELETVGARNESLDAATDRFEEWLRERIAQL